MTELEVVLPRLSAVLLLLLVLALPLVVLVVLVVHSTIVEQVS